MSTTTRKPITIDEAKALLDAAIEKAPPRRWRRIWTLKDLDGPRLAIEEDGVRWPAGSRAPEMLETARLLAGRIGPGGIPQIPGCTPDADVIEAIVTVHLRHGWTLHERTETEARLWKAA